MAGYLGIVTIDSTLSAAIAVEALNAADARDAMLRIANSDRAWGLFTLDDCNMARPYLGDPDAIEEIDEETQARVERAMALRMDSIPSANESEESRRARMLLVILEARLAEARERFCAGDVPAAMDALFGDCMGDLEGQPTGTLEQMSMSLNGGLA